MKTVHAASGFLQRHENLDNENGLGKNMSYENLLEGH